VLRSFGFSPETEATYRLLLRDPQLTDVEITTVLNLTAEQARAARAQLIEAGLVRRSWEDESRMVLVHPEIAIDQALRKRETDVAREQESIANSRLELQALVKDYLGATAQPEQVGQAVKLVDIDAIREVVKSCGATAQREVLAMHPNSEYAEHDLEVAQSLDTQALSRGVAMRSIYPEASRASDFFNHYHRAVTSHGAQIRYAKRVQTRMLIFDRETAIIPLHSADNGRAAVLVQGQAMTAMLVLTFEQAWSGATQLADDPEDGRNLAGTDLAGTDPSDLDRTLLQLMSMGVKDEAAARHMGISVRTVRRQIADLMNRLEASSRFEAGMRASIKGWVQGSL
jgi:sugar-specific transcriptional regulator TrmB/DNA-binding CsgD family transcriptional regulator